MQFIVEEILLDKIAFIAETNDEIVDAVMRIDLHDVPENRTVADLDHRLGSDLRFFGQPCAKAAGEYYGFQDTLLVAMRQIIPILLITTYRAYECGGAKNNTPRHAANSATIVVPRQTAIHNGPVPKVSDKATKAPRAIATGRAPGTDCGLA